MKVARLGAILAPVLLLGACEMTSAPEETVPTPDHHLGGHWGSLGGFALGVGVFNAASAESPIPVRFNFSAIGFPSGAGVGHLHFKAELGGLPVEFIGKVTCLAVDAANKRAWVGGKVIKNKSEHPNFTTPIHQPGRDVWFRMADISKPRKGDPDRLTFLGFEGGGGIITSAEYCAARIWPNDGGPLLSGDLTVR